MLAEGHGPEVADLLGALKGRTDRGFDLPVGAVTIEVVLPQAQVRLECLVDVEPVLDGELLALQLVADPALPVAQSVAGQGEDLIGLGPLPRVTAGPGDGQGALGRVQRLHVAAVVPAQLGQQIVGAGGAVVRPLGTDGGFGDLQQLSRLGHLAAQDMAQHFLAPNPHRRLRIAGGLQQRGRLVVERPAPGDGASAPHDVAELLKQLCPVGAGRRRGRQAALDHLPVQRLSLRRGVHAQLAPQDVPAALVLRQRLLALTGLHEQADQQPMRLLLQRILP
jgi:hypothetical protein